MSKKIVFVMALMAALTITALAGAGLALAQEPTAPAPGYGCCGGWGRGGGWGWHGMGLIDALAELLTGVEPADLYAELQEGKTLLEVAQAHGVSAEELVETALASRAEVLQQRFEAGYLTQEQADWMLEHMREEMLEHLEAGVSPGFDPSTSSGHRCWRFGGQPAPNAQPGMWGGQHGGGMWGGWRGGGW